MVLLHVQIREDIIIHERVGHLGAAMPRPRVCERDWIDALVNTLEPAGVREHVPRLLPQDLDIVRTIKVADSGVLLPTAIVQLHIRIAEALHDRVEYTLLSPYH